MGGVGGLLALLVVLFASFSLFHAAFHSFMQLSHSLKLSLLFVGLVALKCRCSCKTSCCFLVSFPGFSIPSFPRFSGNRNPESAVSLPGLLCKVLGTSADLLLHLLLWSSLSG